VGRLRGEEGKRKRGAQLLGWRNIKEEGYERSEYEEKNLAD
jgi:hypothetical protein